MPPTVNIPGVAHPTINCGARNPFCSLLSANPCRDSDFCTLLSAFRACGVLPRGTPGCSPGAQNGHLGASLYSPGVSLPLSILVSLRLSPGLSLLLSPHTSLPLSPRLSLRLSPGISILISLRVSLVLSSPLSPGVSPPVSLRLSAPVSPRVSILLSLPASTRLSSLLSWSYAFQPVLLRLPVFIPASLCPSAAYRFVHSLDQFPHHCIANNAADVGRLAATGISLYSRPSSFLPA